MKLDAFIAERANDWAEAEILLRRSKGKLRKLKGDDTLRAADLYRVISTDLVVLRQEQIRGSVITRVLTIVRQLHRMMYRTRHKRESIGNFFSHTYWQRVRERPAMLWLCIALLV